MTVATRRHGTWTANEAGVVAGVPLKSVHKIIDAGLLAGAVVTTGGTRLIGGRGVLAIKLAHRTRSTLTPVVRERMLTSILRSNIRVFRDDSVTVDVAAMEREVDAGRAALERARNAVTVDDRIMAATSTVTESSRNTRIFDRRMLVSMRSRTTGVSVERVR